MGNAWGRQQLNPNPTFNPDSAKARSQLIPRWGSMHRLSSFLVALFVSACATPDPASLPALEAEITAHISEGMSLPDAVAALKHQGFSCAEGTSIEPKKKGIFECARSRGPIWPPYGCTHRVWLEAPSPNGTITKIQVFRPGCASL